jgi:hypothetical protein
MMEWKQNIFKQLKERNRQERVYADIVKHCKSFERFYSVVFFLLINIDNHLTENYSIILLRCTDQERDISALRQENNELQKSSVRYE